MAKAGTWSTLVAFHLCYISDDSDGVFSHFLRGSTICVTDVVVLLHTCAELLSSYPPPCSVVLPSSCHLRTDMPQAKTKPSDIAAEAKRVYFQQAEKLCPNLPASSISYHDTSRLTVGAGTVPKKKLRVAVIDGDPLDVALDWHEYNQRSGNQAAPQSSHESIPVVNMANEKRAGGDWESGLMAPEECLCRRTNLVQALKSPYNRSSQLPHYPIQETGGIYSPHVGMYILSLGNLLGNTFATLMWC